MIISHQHKYIFIGLPLAASTAISKELCEKYGGKPILAKHSIYQDFLKVATKEEKSYKVLACSRNPLDISVSQYSKMMSNAMVTILMKSCFVKMEGILNYRNIS